MTFGRHRNTVVTIDFQYDFMSKDIARVSVSTKEMERLLNSPHSTKTIPT